MENFFILLVVVGLAVLVGKEGEKRKIGFGWSFAISIFLSPVTGMIFTLFSKKKDV